MRLDEWQKFIESQFLEETAPPPEAVKPAAPAPAALQTTLVLEGDADATGEPGADPESPSAEPMQVASATGATAEPSLPSESAAAASTAAPSQTTARQTGFVVRSVVEPPAAVPEPLPPVSPVPFEPALDFDPAIPDFAHYLPSKATEPPAPAAGVPIVQETAPLPQHPPVVAQMLVGEPDWGPVSVLLPLTTGFGSVPPPSAPEAGAADGPAAKRRSRAPQARNVAPEAPVSGLATADLWAQVPRHVQTLLALERREEEREVAQSS